MTGSDRFASHLDKSAQEHYNEGKTLCKNGRYEEALAHLQAAASRTPASAAAHFWIGKAHMGQGDGAAALASLQESTRLDPANAKPYIEMGTVYFGDDQLGAALASFRQAERLAPHSAEPLREVAAVLIQQYQYDAALDELQRALALEQGEALTHILFGRVYELKGMAKQADQAYREAERLDPRVYAQAQVANGAQLEATGRFDDAIKQYQAATLTNPAFFDAFLRLGNANLAKHFVTAAADAFRAAVSLDPNSYIAHYMLGWTLLEKSQVNLKALLFRAKSVPSEECVRSLRRAVELCPSEAAARYALGKAYRAAGVRHLAREQLEQALVLDPNGEGAASARESLRTL